jgi:hypothetical protein
MSIIRDQARTSTFNLRQRQTNSLRIELGIIQERQFPQPPELAGSIGKTTREPKWDRNTHHPLRAPRIEDNRVKRAEPYAQRGRRRQLARLSDGHVEKRSLLGKSRTQSCKFDFCSSSGHDDGLPMTQHKPNSDAKSSDRRRDHAETRDSRIRSHLGFHGEPIRVDYPTIS